MPNHDFNIANLRKNYIQKELTEQETVDNPFDQFAIWFKEALSFPVDEPNAMALATVSGEGYPQNRVVLLKGFSKEGFCFFTNYLSNKGRELEGNNKAAILFFYQAMERQIRITGTVQKVAEQVSEAYFASRPKESRLAAWASEQSSTIATREMLEGRYHEYEKLFPDEAVPKPAHWGGYILNPIRFEFWQGRANRLHDRIVYNLTGNIWTRSRLAP